MNSAPPALDSKELDARIRELAAQGSWNEIALEVGRLADPGLVLPATAVNAYKAHRALGDEPSAELWLGRALARVPNSATLHRDQGVLHQKRGEWAQAAESFATAVALRGDVAAYRGSLATALFHSARYAEAAEQYRAGLGLDAAQPLWWRRLARALVHLNEVSEAEQAYARALELQEDGPTRHAYEELLRQMHSGARAASSAYYDSVFADSAKYAQPGEESEYVPAWQVIAEQLRECESHRVLDLGCGPGQFAQYLAAQLPQIDYVGVDFSGVAVASGRQRCPQFAFEKRELPIAGFDGLLPFDSAVCTEVLEHVEADREILAALPAGTRVIATVPNYDAFGHLRLFADADEVRRRYGVLLDDLQVRPIALSAQRTLWLMCGMRSGASLPSTQPEELRLGSVDLAATAVDCVHWRAGMRYALDFLPLFGLPFVTVADSVALPEPHVALRHDVDGSIESAYAMAVVEEQLGIRSSYYLLHPDGCVTPRNYFGQVADGRLAIDPRLFDWVARLVDLGHEVGLHNDLLSLALATRRQPGEFLEQIVEGFAKRGMSLVGSAAHDSRQCRDLGYLNYQIFADFQGEEVALDYRDRPELFERYREQRVDRDGHVVEKFALRMADFGLRYEANFVPREIYVSDGAAQWTLWHEGEPLRLGECAPRERIRDALGEALSRRQPRSGVQCLVRPCHWSALLHAQDAVAVSGVRDLVKHQMGRAQTRSMLDRLATMGNVLVARGDERFEICDRGPGTKPQLHQLASSVTQFIDRVTAGEGHSGRDVLEVGCGQGALLAAVVQRLLALTPGAIVRGLGVDGSPGAIVTCAGRYPDLHWASDPLEHFLETHDEIALDDQGQPLRYDIVLDKTGAGLVDSYAAACDYFARIDALMRPGALYVCIASRHDYDEVLRKQNHLGWPRDWMTLAGDKWEAFLTDDDVVPAQQGYYKRAFRKLGKAPPADAGPGSEMAPEAGRA